MTQAITADAVREIERIVREAAKTTVVPLPTGYSASYLIAKPNGEVETFFRDVVPPIRAVFDNPLNLMEWVGARCRAGEKWDIYVSQNGIEAVERTERRNKASLSFVRAATFLRIEALTQMTRSQKPFIEMMQGPLAGCHPGKDFLSRFRNLNWEVAKSTSGKVDRGRESLSSEVKKSVYGEPPEEVTLVTRVFAHSHVTYPIRCAINLDVEACTIQLVPLPNEAADAVEAAVRAEHGLLIGMLAGEDQGDFEGIDCQVFIGSLAVPEECPY